ncbi:hypothetical protein QJS04_geneDACA024870 [Acorus gramineus]|uniref:Uncharacterized protein n=1 Tax=Acorus gramineus TaxID=55184 RepID=A0AAV9ARX2_ACOGR|nr:hypothetical protein QJS04_geneDACA024870 [Acorus gramineus]
MERFLNYDVYDFNLSRIGGSSSCNLKSLLIGITSWSLILVVSSRTSTGSWTTVRQGGWIFRQY